jgi:hypothetical protein
MLAVPAKSEKFGCAQVRSPSVLIVVANWFAEQSAGFVAKAVVMAEIAANPAELAVVLVVLVVAKLAVPDVAAYEAVPAVEASPVRFPMKLPPAVTLAPKLEFPEIFTEAAVMLFTVRFAVELIEVAVRNAVQLLLTQTLRLFESFESIRRSPALHVVGTARGLSRMTSPTIAWLHTFLASKQNAISVITRARVM